MDYIDYGASVFRKDALNLLPDGVCSLGLLFTQLIEKQQLLAYEVKKRFYQIGTPDGLEEFRQYIGRKR
jgi:NDP-sugar pyrophosphorylase family protein